jgi:sugar fermentation stimulation protein A
VDAGPSLVGINTLLPNRLFAQALAARRLRAFAGYHSVRREVAVGRSRIDLLLSGPRKGQCYVEIKNVTLARSGAACFPDAVTERGRRHLSELARLVRRGHRGVVLFAVQRSDCSRFEPADDIDPRYGRALRRALAAGVEALAWRLRVTPREVRIERRIPVRL